MPDARQTTDAAFPTSNSLVPLESILCTEELSRRVARAPDYQSENRALVMLAQALADSPRTILNALTDVTLDLIKAGSAGVSLLSQDGNSFFWPAISGDWLKNIGGRTPRDFGPCGDALDRNTPLLFKRPERRYGYLKTTTPFAHEWLLVPFHVGGKAVGALWVIAHDELREFNAEDLRQLESLSRFAAAAYQSELRDANDAPERLLAVSRDVTVRQQAELNLAFLASISEDLLRWTSVDELTRTVGAKMAEYLDLSLCALVEIDEAAEQVVIAHDWHREDVPGLVGVYRLADFVEAEFIRAARAAESIVVLDTASDPRTDPRKFAKLHIASFVCVPLLRNGQWRYAMCLYHSTPHDWREDEIELARELTARIWTRLEGLRSEEALRASERRYRTLFESLDNGFCIIEKLEGKPGEPLDFRYLEANSAFMVQCGLTQTVAGKTIRQMFPGVTEDWYLTYDEVLRTGEATRFERELAPGRTLELYAFRIEHESGRRLAVIFNDVSARKQAEENSRQRTAQFETLFNESPLGVYLIDGDFRLCQANPIALPVFGDIPGLIGRDFDEVMHILWPRETADELVHRFRHTLETGEPYLVPELIQHRLDREKLEYYEWQISRIPLPDGRNGVVCYFRDISERLEAQVELRESEERYRTLFDSMDEAFCIVEMICDEQGKPIDYRFLLVNPTFGKQTGMHDATGRRMRDLVPGLEQHWFDIYGEVARTGKAVRFVNHAKDMNDRWFDVYACPVGGPNSQKVAIIFNDISERRRSEEALRKSEESYRYLFNSIDEGFCVVELLFDEQDRPVDYRFLEVNPSFEKQTGMRDAAGKRIREFAPSLEATWFERYGEVALSGESIRFVNEAKELNRWFDVYAFRIGEAGSRKVAIIFSNITERTDAERALREAADAMVELDRRKNEFLAMLGHELRNPLAPIASAVQLLSLQKNEDPLQRKARDVIERQVGQLTHLVDDLLEVSRINTGRVQLRQERVVLGGIVERALETAHPLITKRRHTLTVTLPPGPIWLHADAARLEQVIVNLLTNAAKYTEDSGHVWLTVEQEGEMAVLRVRDTGIGIAPEILPRVFDLFTQAERSLDRSEGGLGIGLCLVQRLVHLHGGTVEAHSVLGEGSEFIVRLPRLNAPAPSPSPSTPTPAVPSEGCRVLIVDDNVDATQSLAMLLEMTGHAVQMAYDGPTALTAARQYQPDVMLLDIGLPGLTGFEVAMQIRLEPTLSKIVLVAMTGYGQEADRLQSQAAGFDHHLVKPADFGELKKILATVHRALPH